ncbi:MAG: translation initiation factor IF-2, partial [Pirellulales bacterium]|nr:translation initiation factor IF-2 [Pirellulales bacterium]
SPVRPETSRGDNPRTDIAASATDSPKASPPSKPREGFSGRTSPLGGRVGQLHRGASATSTLTATGSTLDSAPLRRDDYIPPGGVVRAKPQMLTGRKEPDSEGGEDKTKQRGKKEPPKPTIRVAPINLAPLTPPKPQKSNEPAPQKPVIRLPVDVIKSSKAGGAKPLEAHMKRSEAKTAEQPKGRAVAKALTPEEEKEAKKKGKSGPAEQQDMLLGGREGRLKTRKEKDVQKPKAKVEDEDAPVGRISRPVNRNKIIRRGSGSTAAPRKSKIVLQIPCSVREFSEAAGISAAQVLGKLLGMGKMVTITGLLDDETAEFLALEFGVEVELRKPADAEETLLSDADAEDDPATLLSRPPVITFLGHVDHGKTSLLDKIIGIDVASGESGGITQHIRAYQIEHHGRQISFVDTPGHEAFTEMRARGANVTDIAVLVVAADDGVMPQTEEAISHARAAGVPIVVALNKIDLPGVDEQKIFSQLATAGLLPTEWGGEVEVVRTSALTGKGLDDLLETLFTIAELHELRANPDRLAVGTCLEAEVHGDRGVIAKFIVQRGTLRVGDAVVCGSASGYIKAMFNTLKPREKLEEAGPSTPVNITGLDTAPSAGQHFYAVKDISQAREVASKREIRQRDLVIGGKGTQHITLETILERISTEQAKNLNLILRADTRGSIEAILKEFTKLEHPEVKIKVLQASVGGISEADIHLADASDAIVLGFNVVPDEKARGLAEQRGVQIRRYEIIYKLTEDLKAALEGMLKPEQREMDLGRALVQRTFAISRVGTIAGCRVLSGIIPRNARMRVIRDSRVIGEYSIETLKREKDDAKEVREGLECGIKLAGYNDIKEGDILEAYRIEEIARTL